MENYIPDLHSEMGLEKKDFATFLLARMPGP